MGRYFDEEELKLIHARRLTDTKKYFTKSHDEVWQELQEERKARPITMAEAETIMGNFFLGPEAVQNMLHVKIKPEEIPSIPFSRAELNRARELDQILILRWDTTDSLAPLTVFNLYHSLIDDYRNRGLGSLLFYRHPYQTEDFYLKDEVKRRWALISQEPISYSLGRDYYGQAVAIERCLSAEVFKYEPFPAMYKEALTEWHSQQTSIALLMKNDLRLSAKILAELKISSLCRHTFGELLYDYCVVALATGMRICERHSTFTISRSCNGGLILVGQITTTGAHVSRSVPSSSDSTLGVMLSRTQ